MGKERHEEATLTIPQPTNVGPLSTPSEEIRGPREEKNSNEIMLPEPHNAGGLMA